MCRSRFSIPERKWEEQKQLRRRERQKRLLWIAVLVVVVVTVGIWKMVGKEERNRTIFLSPSVQYGNLYAWGETNEGEQMQKLSKRVTNLLQEAGFTVYSNDPEGTLEDAVQLSNQWDIGLHLALHTNAAGENAGVRGCEAFIPAQKNHESKQAAKKLISAICELGIRSRGVKEVDNLYELNGATADAVVLLEVEFHDDPDGARWIVEEEEAIAEAIVKAIEEYYK